MTHYETCPVCGALFDPAFLDQVAEHMHDGTEIKQLIKGEVMTAQLKAKDIFTKMRLIKDDDDSPNYITNDMIAKKAAIIACEELMLFADNDTGYDVKFWEEVIDVIKSGKF